MRAVTDSPTAFAATLEEAEARSLEDWERQLEQLATFVAVSGVGDVGLARGERHYDLPDASYLVSMWVAPGARRQGVALRLLAAVIDWARGEDKESLLLDVGIRNHAARALYRRAGFVETGEESTVELAGRQVHDIQMALRLK